MAAVTLALKPPQTQKGDLGRALIRDPKIVLLDEPFKGLAPVIVRDLMAACRKLVEAGLTMVLVEQNHTLALAHRAYVINNGHIMHEGPIDELRANAARHWAGVIYAASLRSQNPCLRVRLRPWHRRLWGDFALGRIPRLAQRAKLGRLSGRGSLAFLLV